MASRSGEYPPLPGGFRHRHARPCRCVSGMAEMVPEAASGIRLRLVHPSAARTSPPSGRRANFGVVPPKLTTEDHEKRSAALSSLLAAVALTATKTIVGLLTGSLGILAEAAHSGLDLVAALMTYIAVRISGRPADRTHLYGHGKVENLSALLETL